MSEEVPEGYELPVACAELGDELLDGIVERELAAIREDHDTRRGHGLRDRGDQEHRTGGASLAEGALESGFALANVERGRSESSRIYLRPNERGRRVEIAAPERVGDRRGAGQAQHACREVPSSDWGPAFHEAES